MADTLYQINPKDGTTTTGVPITIGASGVNKFVGSAFVGTTLYGFTSDGNEYTIDPTSGAATLLKSITPAGTSILGAGSSQ
jgi:putative N-acetylmannosamine-6-phosphate epimerase